MRERTIPTAGPKKKLLEAAEQLFAEKGFEVVSVRDITQLTKANVAAVNYHFGSRDGLLQLVISRYALPVAEERLARLETAEKKWGGKAVPLEEIIDAYVLPILGQVKNTELSERLFYRLLGRIFVLEGSKVPDGVMFQTNLVNDRFMRSFSKALPTVLADELAARVHFLNGAMNHLLTHPSLVSKGLGIESALSRLVRFAVAGLREGVEVEKVVEASPQATFDF